ncbi:MAG: hypothetical protein QG670_2644 [Thermoproteota archaeon]|nr:hypothetical protein [Thermoproteota archaeon]
MYVSESGKTAKKIISNREQQLFLSSKINKLSLSIKDTHLEACISQLYQELQRAGITFKPKTYLSDEWGCPNKVPIIGIPFYLASPKLSYIIGQLTNIEISSDEEIMMLLRHEAGHTVNYAYHLYRKPKWNLLFGKFSQPYKSNYTPIPFSTEFVSHVSGWYAQRHPDDDFAETFAVWLTPNSKWKQQYANTPALAKLFYVDQMIQKYGQQPPDITDGKLDKPIQKITLTLDEWIKKRKSTT